MAEEGLTLRTLFEALPVAFEVHAAALDRPVRHLGLLADAVDLPPTQDALWAYPCEANGSVPDLDALILRLYRAGASGLVLPGLSLPESARLLARELGFPVVLVRRAALDDLLQALWQRIYMHELVVRREAETLAQSLREAFEAAGGVDRYLDAAGRILGATVRLVEPQEDEGIAADVAYRLPIVWGRGSGNVLAIGTPSRGREVVDLLLPHLVLTASVLVDREAARIESDLRLRGELLLELLLDQRAPTGSVILAAERFGMDLGEEHFAAIWDIDNLAGAMASQGLAEVRLLRLKRDIGQILEQQARLVFGRAWVLPHLDDFVLVAGARSADWTPKRTAEIMREMQSRLVPVLQRYALSGIAAGLGYPYSGAQGLRKSFDEAREALVVGRAQFGASSITHFANLGLHRFLYGWFDTPRSRALALDLLRPLLEDDERGRGQLLETLRAYLEQHGRASAAAAQLGVHRNTLRYRLDRIESLLGVDLEAANVQLILQLILRTLPD